MKDIDYIGKDKLYHLAACLAVSVFSTEAAVAAAPAQDPMSDPALIAVIAAAIAAAEDKPAHGFVVRSIKRVKTNKWR